MTAEHSTSSGLLASRYNKPIRELPTYTLNKYQYLGELFFRITSQERSGSLNIVEFGCGNRKLAETYILPKVQAEKVTYIGIDSNKGLIPAPTVIGDIAQSPVANSCADAVFCMDVLEHIDQKETGSVMEEIVRIAKPKAQILISVPSMYNLDRFNIPSINFGTHVVKQSPKEWMDFIGQFISINETMGLGMVEIIPYLPQLFKLVNPNFPIDYINSIYKILKQLNLGRLDPFLYKMRFNRIDQIKEFCDGFLIIGSKV